MAYKTGKSKSLSDITLEDALQYPIWEWALDEEGVDGQDETWQRPIIDTDNVSEDIFDPSITVKVKGTDLVGSAEFDSENQSLSAIAVWIENQWKSLKDTQIASPVTLVAVPRINGESNVEFVCQNFNEDFVAMVRKE